MRIDHWWCCEDKQINRILSPSSKDIILKNLTALSKQQENKHLSFLEVKYSTIIVGRDGKTKIQETFITT